MSPFRRVRAKPKTTTAVEDAATAQVPPPSAAPISKYPVKDVLAERPGGTDYVMSGFQTTIAILREVGEMTVHIPYIKGVAGILLRILEIKDQISLYRDRWHEVMGNLIRITSVLTTTAHTWRDTGIEPSPELQNIIGDFQSELEKVLVLMEACNTDSKWERFKFNIVRTEMLRKIDRCDRKIRSLVDSYQTAMLVSIRVNQYAALPKSQRLPRPFRSLRHPLPPKSDDISGRDLEVRAITELVLADLSIPARITILGPAGIGKTTLALHILHHPTIAACFREDRFFVACQECTSADGFLTEVAYALGFKPEQLERDKEMSVLTHLGTLRPALLFLDGFEGPWGQEVYEKIAVEALLAKFTSLPTLTVILTMRGLERPASTAWTRPFLKPLTSHLISADEERTLEADAEIASDSASFTTDVTPFGTSW